MASFDCDVAIVGAGVAGLAAFAELDRAGVRTLCIEARDRIGGRVRTEHDPLCALPIELGAEFIHGRPPEILEIARAAALPIYDCADASVHIRDGQIRQPGDAWEPVGEVMEEMQNAARTGPDEPFSQFLERLPHDREAKELSTSFVEGFNAARKEIVGIASLAKDARAADSIEGDRSFRFSSGYDAVPRYLSQTITNLSSKLRFNTVLKSVEWRPGSVTLRCVSGLTGAARVLTAKRAIVTVPLGVLQARPGDSGAIDWNPMPEEILSAASSLSFGQVVRVILRFRESFWEENSAFTDTGFFLSNEPQFPTWWTPLAVRAPVITGWSAGPHADTLLDQSRQSVIANAVRSLARVLAVSPELVGDLLENAYYHDWHADPYSRGAYSYVPAGALAARETLAQPVATTLYFAGEATELDGHSATVHGAIASGRRAARQILTAEP